MFICVIFELLLSIVFLKFKHTKKKRNNSRPYNKQFLSYYFNMDKISS